MSDQNNAVPPPQLAAKDSEDLGQKWRAFGRMWLEPFNFVLSCILLAMYGLGLANLDGVVGVLSQSVLALTSGVLGGRIANSVSTINSEAVLKARGTVAVRGLNLMLRNVRALDHRVGVFLQRCANDSNSKNYEEIQQMCRVLSEEGITSIENWTDIVPEAREATIAGHLSELKEAIETLQNEKAELMDKLESAAGAEAEAGALKSEIAAKNLRITTLENAYRSVATKALYELANNSAAPTHRNALADLMPPPGPKKKVGNIGTWYYAKDTPAPRRPSPTERNPSKPEES